MYSASPPYLAIQVDQRYKTRIKVQDLALVAGQYPWMRAGSRMGCQQGWWCFSVNVVVRMRSRARQQKCMSNILLRDLRVPHFIYFYTCFDILLYMFITCLICCNIYISLFTGWEGGFQLIEHPLTIYASPCASRVHKKQPLLMSTNQDLHLLHYEGDYCFAEGLICATCCQY